MPIRISEPTYRHMEQECNPWMLQHDPHPAWVLPTLPQAALHTLQMERQLESIWDVLGKAVNAQAPTNRRLPGKGLMPALFVRVRHRSSK